MNTSHKCQQCGTIVEIESSQSQALAFVYSMIVLPAVFTVGGWAFLNYGRPYWGAASLIAAVIAPPMQNILHQYQRSLPVRAFKAEQRQTEQMLEIMRREDARSDKN